MQTSALNKFDFVAGELQNEYRNSWALLKEKPALYSLLCSVPVLAFSPTGVTNIARRFHITEAELEGCVVAVLSENLHQSRPDWAAQDLAQLTKPTPEQLEAIREAVTPKPRRKALRPKTTAKAKKVGEGLRRA